MCAPTISHRAPPGFQFWYCTLKDSSRMHFCITVGFYHKGVSIEIFPTMVKVSVNSSDIFSAAVLSVESKWRPPASFRSPLYNCFSVAVRKLCAQGNVERKSLISAYKLQPICEGNHGSSPDTEEEITEEGHLPAFCPGFLCYLSYWDSFRWRCLDCLHLTTDAN